MNIILLITVTCTLALVYGQGEVHNTSSNSVPADYNRRPCERNSDNNAYKKFVRQHILQRSFDRDSRSEWRKYLQDFGLCDRRIQSFVRRKYEKRVRKICDGSGRRLNSIMGGNLCISTERIKVYFVTVSNDGDCSVDRLSKDKMYVIVGCDKIRKDCLPVHFEETTNQSPNPLAKRCRPRAHDWWSDV